MHINTDLTADTLALSLPQQRPEAAGAGSQATAATTPGSTAGQLDPMLQRLAEGASSLQEGNPEIQDGSEATQVMNSLVQSMRGQPETAMAAQANQLSENVLSLLQSTE